MKMHLSAAALRSVDHVAADWDAMNWKRLSKIKYYKYAGLRQGFCQLCMACQGSRIWNNEQPRKPGRAEANATFGSTFKYLLDAVMVHIQEKTSCRFLLPAISTLDQSVGWF